MKLILHLACLVLLFASGARAVTGLTYNVSDYGAVGDGVADDTTACRAALAAAVAAGGGTVHFPAGTYRLAPTEEGGYIFIVPIGNLAFTGEGPDLSILSCYAWGMRDPASLMLKRGGAFRIRPAVSGQAIAGGVEFRQLRVTGNAPPTAKAGRWWGDEALDGWDVDHKALAIFNTPIDTILIEDCRWDHWRGEIIYAGGGRELGAFTIRRTKVHDCNASAISMTGTVVVEDCEIWNVYNGTENFAFPGDYNHVRRTLIEPNRDLPFRIGKNAVVFIGDPAASLVVEDCTIRNPDFGVFLSEAASNVTIRRNLLEDCIGVYGIHLNQYPGLLTQRYENITIADNTFRVATRTVDNAITFYTNPAVGLRILGNTVEKLAGVHYNAFYRGPGGTGEWLFQDNNLGEMSPFATADKSFLRPVWSGNILTGAYVWGARQANYDETPEPPIQIRPTWPRHVITDLRNGVENKAVTMDPALLANFPPGFTFELRRREDRSGDEGIEIRPEPAWNTLTRRGYFLYAGSVATFRLNADRKFDLIDYVPRTGSPYTITENSPVASAVFRHPQSLSFSGFDRVILRPTIRHVFDRFSGVPENVPATIDHNALTTIAHVPGLLEIDTGADFVATADGVVTAIKNNDILRVLTRQPADGGFPAWLARSGLPGDASAAGAPHADPDGDGADNLLEYALARSALDAEPPAADPAALLPMPGTAPGDGSPAVSPDSGYAVARDPATGRLALSFRRARAELTYVVEACADLAAPAGSPDGWQPLATNPGAVGQLVTVADTLPATPGDTPPPRRFLRLRVEAP